MEMYILLQIFIMCLIYTNIEQDIYYSIDEKIKNDMPPSQKILYIYLANVYLANNKLKQLCS